MGHWAPSLSEQLSELGLERLGERRDKLCAKFAVATSMKSRHKDIFKVANITHPREEVDNTRRGRRRSRRKVRRGRKPDGKTETILIYNNNLNGFNGKKSCIAECSKPNCNHVSRN